MATDIEIGMYLAQNGDVQLHAANTAAATGFPPGTPEYIQAYQKAAVDHAINFGTKEGRIGAEAVATTSPTENNAQAGTGGGTTGGGMMSGPVGLEAGALNPVTSLIGTPGTGQTGPQATLMGQTAGLATGQQGIRDVVDPLAEQVTGIGTSIGTAGTGQADTLMGQTADIQSGIGTAGTGTESGTGLVGGQERLGIGQSLLSLGQGQLGQQIGQSGGTLTDTATGETATTAPTGLYAGQAGLGEQIGTAAVTGEDGTVTQKPTGLYAGQAGLMSGQTGLGTQLTGVGRDLTTEIGDVSSALGSQLGAFRTAAENYQRGATTQRGDIQGTQRANQANMLSQIQGVGQPINRQAEALANQRQQEAASFAASQAPLQQQIATLTANNANQAANNQPIGPLGPMAADPRDALIQQLLTRNASLMNNRPV